MKTISIKGKLYTPVVERVKELHRLYENKCDIRTKIVSDTDNRITVMAEVTLYIEDGLTLTFTGHSQAVYGKGMMGEVALEVAETSAIGRALGFANIGLIDGIASADEMRKAGAKDIPLATEDDFIN